MTLEKAIEIINNTIGEKIICKDYNGKEFKYSIKRIIPMHRIKDHSVYDVEILLNRSMNIYFSCNSYKSAKSWVKEVVFTGEKSKGLGRLKRDPIVKYIRERMTDDGLIETAKAILELKAN